MHYDSFWNLKIKHQSHDLDNDIIDRHFFNKEYKRYILQLHTVPLRYRECVKDRFGCTSRVDSVQLEKPEYWLHMIFSEAATLSQNANWIQNKAFPDIQEYYLFLALYISKINRRSNKVSIKNENTKGLNPIQDGHFWCCSRMVGGKKAPSLKSVAHTLQWWSLAQLYLT